MNKYRTGKRREEKRGEERRGEERQKMTKIKRTTGTRINCTLRLEPLSVRGESNSLFALSDAFLFLLSVSLLITSTGLFLLVEGPGKDLFVF